MNDHKFRSKEFSASSVVNDRMVDYAFDVAEHKLPHIIDGLKVIHRRMIWVMYKKEMFSDKNLVNSIMGEVIKVHPVGDQSITDACIRAMQDFSMGLKLLKAMGNEGSYGMDSTGAPRYLHGGLDDLAKEIFFDNVNTKTIPMVHGEDLVSLEPKYLIPRLPTALLIHAFTVGVGFKADILPLHFDNVCELEKRYAECAASSKNSIHKLDFSKLGKYFVPDIPIETTIRNYNQLCKSYNEGDYNAKIYVTSAVDILKNSIIIKTVPFGQDFIKTIENIKTLARDKKSWMYDVLTGYHDGQNDQKVGHIELTFKTNKDIFEIFKKIAPLIRYNTSLTPIYNHISKQGNIVELTPPQLLEQWYNERKASVLGGIKYDQERESRLYREKEVRLKIFDKADEVIDIIRSKSKDYQEARQILQDRFDLSRNQAEILLNAPIKSINRQSKEDLVKELDRHLENCKMLKENTSRVDEIIYKDAEYFQKKYKKPRITKITDFNGCIVINNKDIVQWDTVNEACKLITNFPGCKVYTYPEKHSYRYLYPNIYRTHDQGISASKITQGQRIFAYPSEHIYTLWIRNNKPICTEGYFNDNLDDKLCIPISNKFYGISPKGEIIKCKVNELLAKKSTSRIKMEYSLVYGIPYYSQGVALLYINDTEPEKIQIVRIDDSISQILLSPLGVTEFIGFVPLHSSQEYLFDCPNIIKGNYKYISIKNIDNLIHNDTKGIVITVGRKIKRNDIVQEMIEL